MFRSITVLSAAIAAALMGAVPGVLTEEEFQAKKTEILGRI
jgi:hypothetical protein